MSEAPAVLQIDGLVHRWPGAPRDLLQVDRLALQAGQRLFVQGQSGCGKSTLLSLCAGVLPASAGRVAVLGVDWAALDAAHRDIRRADHVGLIFQQFNLLPWLNVLDNVLLGAQFSKRRRSRCRSAPESDAGALLKGMGLPRSLWDRQAKALSVGQQQRVAAARALIGRPELILADEPTSALDDASRDAFVELLLAQCRDSDAALVLVSHDARLAAGFDDRMALSAPVLASAS